MSIQGYCDPRFATVEEAFAQQLNESRSRGGSALCVQIGGKTRIDLWGGTRDQAGQLPWEENTLVNLFSCSKTLTGVAVLQLVERGQLDLDAPLARWWPEFAAAGKASLSLRQVLCHRAGLPAIRTPLPAEALYDGALLSRTLAAQAPWWEPGTAQGYAAMSYGWLLGELLVRVTGESPGTAILRRIAWPLGLDVHLGLDKQALERVAFLHRGRNDFGDEAAQRLMRVIQSEPDSLSAHAFGNPPGLLTRANTRDWQCSVQPAANIHATARGLAGFYSGVLAGSLLGAPMLAQMTQEHSAEVDRVLLEETRFGLGCWLDQPRANATFAMGPQSFGHPGAGGSLGFADPERELAFGFITSTLGPYVLMDPRAQRLAAEVWRCLE